LISGSVDVGEESNKLMVNKVQSMAEVKESQTRRVHFRLTTPGLEETHLRSLKDIIARHRGDCEVLLHMVIPDRSETILQLPGTLKVAASDQIMDAAEKLFGYNVVTFE
jgi:DNA polymerase III subunit alpha